MELLNGIDWWAVMAALVFILLDFLTGIAKAAHNKSISSTIMREGLYHKFAEVVVIVLAALIDIGCSHLQLGFDSPLLIVTCSYIVLMEVASILENVGEMNPELAGSKVLALFKKGE